jgi:hypothetical protein
MNRFLRFYLLIAICVVPLSATTYYSQGNVAANTLANWNTLPAGGGSVPANFTTSGDSFVVQTGHSMTTSGAWTLASGVKLTVDSGATFTASHLLSSLGTFSVKNGGTYIHYATGSGTNGLAADFPGSTRILGATSTVEFRKWGNTGTGAVALPSGITWGNIIINVDTLFGSWNQTASITSVAGNLTVLKTGGGSREFRFTGSATLALSISGNVSVSGGIVGFSSGTGVPNVSISGNVNVTGGEFYFSNNSGVSPVVTVNGNVTVNGGTLNMQRSSPSYTTTILGDLTVNNSASILGIVRSSSSSKTFTLRLGGNFTHTAGSVEGTFGSNSVLVLHYKGGSPTVTMTETGTFPTATTNIIIDTGKTVTLNIDRK